MPGRRSEKSRKSIDYSIFSVGGNSNEKDDDDDFVESNQSKRRKRCLKTDREEAEMEKKEQKVQERKARNRLSEDEKYQKQLEEVLQLSLADAEPPTTCSAKPLSSHEECQRTVLPQLDKTPRKTHDSQSSTSSEQDMQNSCIVRAEVLDSPITKLLLNKKKEPNEKVEKKMAAIKNEAAFQEEDEITTAPVNENKQPGRRRSGRTKSKNSKKTEEEYELSSESESEEDLSENEESDLSDYEEIPTKKSNRKTKPTLKRKKTVLRKDFSEKEKSDVNDDEETPGKKPKGRMKLAVKQGTISAEKENNVSLRTSSLIVPIAKLALPRTPVSATKSLSLLPRRSSSLMEKPGKFVQPGWTPPGAAGTKTNILKSPLSPNVTRVGLSRNAKLTPLHPKLNCN